MKGHITKKRDRYYVVLELERDPATGKRHRKWIGGYQTKREAQKVLTEKLHEMQTGTYVEPAKETVGEYLTRWLEDKRAQIRPSTYRVYEWLLRVHIRPGIGSVELSKLRPQHLQRLYTTLLSGESGKRPISARTVLHIHLVIHEALERAVRWGLVGRNVADAVDPPRPEQYRGGVWTPEEAGRFLRRAQEDEPRWYVAFVLAIMTGMRKGEILALRWRDIDFDHGIARVNQTAYPAPGGGVYFQEPKTDRSRRAVALSPETVQALLGHRDMQKKDREFYGGEYQDHDLIVCRDDGRPMPARSLDHIFERLVKRAGVPRIRFHDIRHTHASLLLSQGVHPKIVSERLGHSTVNITMDLYSHILPGIQEQVAAQVDEIIFREPKGRQKADKGPKK